MAETIGIALIKILILIGAVMTIAAYLVLLERRMAAWIQDRRGPNRVGIPLTNIRVFGFGQPLADGLKFIFKEEYTPAHVNRRLYVLAPIVILVSSLAVFAVIPLGSPVGDPNDPSFRFIIAPHVDVAVLYVFALSSVAVYGVILGGWASNSKYSFLGALRSSAQLIAYELPLGLGLLGVVLAAGSLNLEVIVQRQAEGGWFVFTQPLGFVVFCVAAFAEAARLPFDLPETEQELIGGYHTEYSGMKLLLFLVGEFLHMITASILIVILFLGGWHIWPLSAEGEVTWLGAIVRTGVMMAKVLLVILFFMLVRWSWPRFRFDQLMSLAWKVMLPLGLVNLVTVAVLWELRLHLDPERGAWSGILCGVASWIVCFGAWWVTAWLKPLVTDNRPIREIDPHRVDAQVQ